MVGKSCKDSNESCLCSCLLLSLSVLVFRCWYVLFQKELLKAYVLLEGIDYWRVFIHLQRWLVREQLPFLSPMLNIEFIVNCYPAPLKKTVNPTFQRGRAVVFLHPHLVAVVPVKKRVLYWRRTQHKYREQRSISVSAAKQFSRCCLRCCLYLETDLLWFRVLSF